MIVEIHPSYNRVAARKRYRQLLAAIFMRPGECAATFFIVIQQG
jgi:hypothetical protein